MNKHSWSWVYNRAILNVVSETDLPQTATKPDKRELCVYLMGYTEDCVNWSGTSL